MTLNICVFNRQISVCSLEGKGRRLPIKSGLISSSFTSHDQSVLRQNTEFQIAFDTFIGVMHYI